MKKAGGLKKGSTSIPTGIDLITAERRRQVEEEGFTVLGDTCYRKNELLWAAICYAAPEAVYRFMNSEINSIIVSDPWPWDYRWDKRRRNSIGKLIPASQLNLETRIRYLQKAGALIAAQLDVLRAEQTEPIKYYKCDTDVIADFIEDCCKGVSLNKAVRAQLYDKFVQWYRDNCGYKQPDRRWFYKQLEAKIQESLKK